MGIFKKIKKSVKKVFDGVKKVFKKIVKSKIFWAAVIVVVAIYAPQIAAWAGEAFAPAAAGAAEAGGAIAAADAASVAGIDAAIAAETAGTAAGAASGAAGAAGAGAGAVQAAGAAELAAGAGGVTLGTAPAAAQGFSLANISASLGEVASWVGANQWAVPLVASAGGAMLTQSAEQDAAEAERKRLDENMDTGQADKNFSGIEDWSNKNLPNFRNQENRDDASVRDTTRTSSLDERMSRGAV